MMAKFQFTIRRITTVEVEASDEQEAYERVKLGLYDVHPEAWEEVVEITAEEE